MALDDLYTRGDLVNYVSDRFQPEGDRLLRFVRTACRDAYRDIPKSHTWKYLRRDFTFLTVAPYSTGTIAYDHCVTPEHEALTRSGWKTHDQLRVGEEILSYDHDAGQCSWQPVENIHTFDYDGKVLDVRRKGRTVLRCTPNHRVPVIERIGKARGTGTQYRRRYVRASELTSDMRTPLAAPLDIATGGPLTERQVAILSWLVTDGTGLFNRKYHKAEVLQSRDVNRVKCEEIESLTGSYGKPYGHSGMERFPVDPKTKNILRAEVQDKNDIVRLLCESGVAESAAFVRAADLAESSRNGGRYVFSQWGENKGVAEAYQVANLLQGVASNINAREYIADGKRKTRFQVPARSSNTIRLMRDDNSKWVPYKGIVWCPQVRTSAWVVRCNGCVMITGNSGGAYERMITLTTGTWPTWAASGVIRINDTNYPVVSRESDSIITLGPDANPGSDVASGETYKLSQQDYLIPVNAGTIWRVMSAANTRELFPIDPSANPLLSSGISAPGQPQWYSAMGTAGIRNVGRRVMRLYPAPSEATVISMSYDAHPRSWVLPSPYDSGTVAISSGGTTLTLTDGTWPTGIEGCLVRMSGDSAIKSTPTGPDGDFPAEFTSIIRSRTSGTVVELWTAAPAAYTGVTFSLDDPLDIETSAMWPWLRADALARYAEMSGANGESVGKLMNEARKRLASAREADNTMTDPIDIYGMFDPVIASMYGAFISPTVTFAA